MRDYYKYIFSRRKLENVCSCVNKIVSGKLQNSQVLMCREMMIMTTILVTSSLGSLAPLNWLFQQPSYMKNKMFEVKVKSKSCEIFYISCTIKQVCIFSQISHYFLVKKFLWVILLLRLRHYLDCFGYTRNYEIKNTM